MDVFSRFWNEIAARPSGPLAVRFYLQPIMAGIFAIRDGRRDAKEGKPAYLWSIFTDEEHRGEHVRSGWRSIGKIFALAVLLDLLYQTTVLKGLRPVQTLFVAVLLAIVPYVLLRGPVNRFARRRHSPHAPAPPIPNISESEPPPSHMASGSSGTGLPQ